MPTNAKILADSISEAGARLTTLQVRLPRFVIPQITRHRALSFSIRSSRAVPVATLLAEVESDPVIPRFGKAQKGMVAEEDLDEVVAHHALNRWLYARDDAVKWARELAGFGAAKEVCNRVIEPYAWSDMVVTGTTWENVFALRIHSAAQGEVRDACIAMARAMKASTPRLARVGDRHLPYVSDEERQTLDNVDLVAISAARCARVSYRPHGDAKVDLAKDAALAWKLARDGHWSPYEHQGTPLADPCARSGNFVGWQQARQIQSGNVATSFDWSLVD